jgi:hypothetical protein
MFQTMRFLSTPDDMATEAPSAPSIQGSQSVNSSATSSVPNTDDLFKGFEDKYFGGNKDGDDEAFGQQTFGQPNEGGESIDDMEAAQQVADKESASSDAKDDGLPLYVFKDKVGDEDVELVIETKEQLNHYLKRAALTPKIYEENKQLKAEMSQYKDKASISDEFDRMHREEPLELLNLIVEDVGEDLLVEWVKGLSSNLAQSAEQREYFRKLREAEHIRSTWQRQQEAATKLEADRAAAIEEQNDRVVSDWRSSEFTKWSNKVAPEHHDVLQQMIDAQLMYASHMASQGKDVDLTELSSRVYKTANALSGSQKQINQKIGKATQASRQQATSKLQAATNQAQVGRTQSGQSAPGYKNTDHMFEDLLRKIGTGDIKVKS